LLIGPISLAQDFPIVVPNLSTGGPAP